MMDALCENIGAKELVSSSGPEKERYWNMENENGTRNSHHATSSHGVEFCGLRFDSAPRHVSENLDMQSRLRRFVELALQLSHTYMEVIVVAFSETERSP